MLYVIFCVRQNNTFSKLYVTAGYGGGWVMGMVVMVDEIVFIKTKREHG
jgi:hypothetical protein